MVTSFVIGELGFNEGADPTFAGVAIALLVLGVYCVSTSQSDKKQTVPPRDSLDTPSLELKEFEAPVSVEEDDGLTPAPNHLATKEDPAPFAAQPSTLGGLLFCLLTGLCDGALMAPFKLSGATSVTQTCSFIASFGLSSAFVAPLLYCAYLFIFRRSLPARDELGAGCGPGLASGTLWAAASLLSTTGTYFLGMSVAFPLSQTCCVLSAAWGLLFFREKVDRYGKLALGLCLVVLGSFCLASSK